MRATERAYDAIEWNEVCGERIGDAGQVLQRLEDIKSSTYQYPLFPLLVSPISPASHQMLIDTVIDMSKAG